jgi:hypothetical protein
MMKAVKQIVLITAFSVGLIFSVITVGSAPLHNKKVMQRLPRQHVILKRDIVISHLG